MKMRKLAVVGMGAMLIASALGSCTKKDTLAPEIDVDRPKPNAVLLAGQPIAFDADFEDDQGLKSYQITLTMMSPAADPGNDAGHPFLFDRTWNLPDRREADDVRHQEIVIPADATPGAYSFRVFCTDRAGNQAYAVIPVTIAR